MSHVPISIDTHYASVAAAAVEAGADIVNDISGGSMDPEMHSTVCLDDTSNVETTSSLCVSVACNLKLSLQVAHCVAGSGPLLV